MSCNTLTPCAEYCVPLCLPNWSDFLIVNYLFICKLEFSNCELANSVRGLLSLLSKKSLDTLIHVKVFVKTNISKWAKVRFLKL